MGEGAGRRAAHGLVAITAVAEGHRSPYLEDLVPGFDEGAFDRFRDDYRGPTGDAPEKFPLSELTPGRQ